VKKVLVTGGAGFIGSHLCEVLVERGHRVTVIDDLSTGSLGNLAAIIDLERFRFVQDSVRNQAALIPLVESCDVVYHLAAAVGVQLIVDDPVRTIETNVHGSETVLELANRFGRRVLLASTSEVYGKNTTIPFNEDDDTTLGSTRFSRWSYACSKMVDEFLALAYHRQHGLEAIVCRLFNTVGPRQSGAYGMVVPRFVGRALAGDAVEIYGTGEQSRCFCNVSDVVKALTALMACDAAVGEVINVGSVESITIADLADLVIGMTGSTSEKRKLSYEEAYGCPFDDMAIRVPDLAKIKRLIGFTPKVSLRETLKQIVEFQRTLISNP